MTIHFQHIPLPLVLWWIQMAFMLAAPSVFVRLVVVPAERKTSWVIWATTAHWHHHHQRMHPHSYHIMLECINVSMQAKAVLTSDPHWATNARVRLVQEHGWSVGWMVWLGDGRGHYICFAPLESSGKPFALFSAHPPFSWREGVVALFSTYYYFLLNMQTPRANGPSFATGCWRFCMWSCSIAVGGLTLADDCEGTVECNCIFYESVLMFHVS